MKIITWNIACLPKLINFYRKPSKKIVTQILDKIDSKNADIIKLQEVFDYKIQKLVTNHLLEKDYNLHFSEHDKTCYKSITMSKNGLVTASKYPILDTNIYEYKHNTSVELMIQKGILTTKIDHPYYGSINLHNTHIQSDSLLGMYSKCKKIRAKQYKELNTYINNFSNDDKHIISGDLNEDYENINLQKMIENLTYDTKTNNDKIITFPFCSRQLDYIVYCNFSEYNVKYEVDNNSISDHFLLSSQIIN